MGKLITIKQNNTGKNFNADKLKVNLQTTGTTNFIPEDEAADYVTLTNKNITQNGVYIAEDESAVGYSKVIVNVSGEAVLITKNITQNGTYNASSDNADGYSSVTVNTDNAFYSDLLSREWGSRDITGTTWVFNPLIQPYSESVNINFTSSSSPFTKLFWYHPERGYDCDMAYDATTIYGARVWTSEAYKTITITGGDGATDSDFIAWLEANATLQT